MEISVALATYNGERFLPAQLDSIAAQTVRPAELVVSDDGSTDRTLAIVERFAAAAPFPVRVLEKPSRLGFSDNFYMRRLLAGMNLSRFATRMMFGCPKNLK